MLPVSLDCPLAFLSCVLYILCWRFLWVVLFLFPLRYSLTFICPVYPMLRVSLDCPFLFAPSGFCNINFSCVLGTLCCHFFWIVLFISPSVFSHIYLSCVPYVASFCGLSFLIARRYYLAFLCPVSGVPYVASSSGLSLFITPSVFSKMYLSCVLCILCCQFLWIVLFHYPFGIL
jgi:hypothetical protein